MSEYNSACPDQNQEKALPGVVVGATSPNWALDRFGAGQVMIDKDEECGTTHGEIDRDSFKVS